MEVMAILVMCPEGGILFSQPIEIPYEGKLQSMISKKQMLQKVDGQTMEAC